MSSSDDRFYIPLPRRNTSGLSGMSSGELNMHSKGTVLSFHNISYYVKVKRHLLLGWKKEEKEVLSNISGIMAPGLNAIRGPLGAGKSLLLDVLAARKHPEKLSGDVLINGEPQPANFKCYSGYVAEDEGIMGTLTVRENLQFSAALRLPTTMTQHEKNERMNDVIEELGLDKVADSKVGTELIHGVSKAESKKTRIAMELITHSSILFLDEPTNALDPSTAHAVFSLLKKLSRQGRTIIFSIRQPQYSVFKMFDSLTLLAAGNLMFHGPAQMTMEQLFFSRYGYKCEPYNNPAEFFLDVISGVFTAKESDREEEEHQYENIKEFSRTVESITENLAEFYANSPFCRDTKAKLDQFSTGQKRSLAFQEFTCAASFCHQLRWITWRSFKNFLGDLQTSVTQIIATIIEGLLIGVFFLGIKNDCTAIQSRAWMFYVLIVSLCFNYESAIQLFLREKKLFIVWQRLSGELIINLKLESKDDKECDQVKPEVAVWQRFKHCYQVQVAAWQTLKDCCEVHDSDVASHHKWRLNRHLSKRHMEESALRSRTLQQELRLIPVAPA
ncbi:broad substrate specificity ATP-binding cassette transporter ABCG2, partial [Fukomys damarensis]|uniref:broad substrate specificity ATP-binding cassette transporter ABCG2 n=1 Tax=Fukomys damarensis TaxID=885580 RepID=UPI001455D371